MGRASPPGRGACRIHDLNLRREVPDAVRKRATARATVLCRYHGVRFLERSDRNSRITSSMCRPECAPFEATTWPSIGEKADPSHAGDVARRLRDDQRTSGDVPGLQPLLPEAVEPASRHVAEVERRRPEPAHRARPLHERAEKPDHLVRRRVHVVRKSRAEQRVDGASSASIHAAAAPFRNAPWPRSAVNSSRRVGS